MFINAKQAEEWVMSCRHNHSVEAFNDIIIEFNHKYVNLFNNFKIIQITGTNGKGSTVAYLRDLLMAEGYKVGTFQSPHYRRHRDRIRINNILIPAEQYLIYVNKYYAFFKKYALGMFDMTFIIALNYFKDKNIDYALIEAGIGGRHDSTAVVPNPILSIITGIDYDHTEILGPTLYSIAYDKSGLIKENSNVLVGDIPAFCKAIIKEEAQIKHAGYYELKNYSEIAIGSFKFYNKIYNINSYANYQVHNASLALNANEIILRLNNLESNYAITKETIATTIWPGRFEKVSDKPLVILDGAHNPQAIRALIYSLNRLKGKKGIIFAALKRKQYSEMIDLLKNNCDRFILTEFNYPGSLKINDIKDNTIEKIVDYKKAYQELLKDCDVVVICGSLYFLSEIVNEFNFSGN